MIKYEREKLFHMKITVYGILNKGFTKQNLVLDAESLYRSLKREREKERRRERERKRPTFLV